PISNAKLINEIRRHGGYERESQDSRPSIIGAVKATRPVGNSRLRGHILIAFIRVNAAEFVLAVEVVVDPDVELISICVVAVSVGKILAGDTLQEPDAGRVETVANGVVVRRGHSRQQ